MNKIHITLKTRGGNFTFMACYVEHHPRKYYGGDAQPLPPDCHSQNSLHPSQ